MATSALTFTFSTQELRVVMRDGEPWFVAADVCAALTIGNNRDALVRLDEDEKGVGSIDTPGGAQQMTIVSESGLYSLVLGSRKPEAKRFKKWVTAEVLPSIRKTGRYQLHDAPEAPKPAQLSTQDYEALSRAVSFLVRSFRFEKAWRQAVWFALRRAAGRPSPQVFLAQDLPVLQREFDRISVAAHELQHAICEAEREVILRVVRRGEESGPIQDHIWRTLLDESKELSRKINAVPAPRKLLPA